MRCCDSRIYLLVSQLVFFLQVLLQLYHIVSVLLIKDNVLAKKYIYFFPILHLKIEYIIIYEVNFAYYIFHTIYIL